MIGETRKPKSQPARLTNYRPTPPDLARWRECFEAHEERGESYRAIGARLSISGVWARQRALKYLKWQQRLADGRAGERLPSPARTGD